MSSAQRSMDRPRRDWIRSGWNSPTMMTWASLGARSLTIAVVWPAVLRFFSAPDIAVWQLLSSTLILVNVFDFGISPTFTRLIAYAVAEGRSGGQSIERMRELVRTISATMIGLVLILGLVAGAGVSLALVRPIGEMEDPTTGWIAWSLTLIGICSTLGNTAQVAVLMGINRVAALRRWEAIMTLGSILTAWLVVLAGGRLVALVSVTLVWQLLGVLRNLMLIRATDRQVCRWLLSPTICRPVLAEVWPLTWRSGLGVAMTSGIHNLSGLALAQTASPLVVASYAMALRFGALLTQFSQAPFYSRIPWLCQLRAAGDDLKLATVAKGGMRLAHWTFVCGALAIGLLAPWAMEVIDSNVPFLDSEIWVVLAVAMFTERFGAMHLQLFSTSNDIRWHKAAAGYSLIYLAVAGLLLGSMGVWALALASLAANLFFFAPYCAVLSYRLLRPRGLAFEATVALPPFLFLICGFALFLFSGR